MSLSLEVRHNAASHVDTCLPITGLKELQFGAETLLLQGQGPFAVLLDATSGRLLSKLRTFQRNNVHGFIVNAQNSHDESAYTARVLVWGGHSLRIVDLVGQKNGQAGLLQASLSAATAEYAAPDWIFDACASHGDDKEKTFAYLVTAHNAVLSLEVTEKASRDSYPNRVHLRQLATSVKSILYSADILALSPGHVLVAAGTVFGEIIVWSCFPTSNEEDGTPNAVTSIHHFFTGHEGSIFGVNISPEIPCLREGKPGRLLASCSDDRTIRIWDISNCCHASPTDPSAYSTDGFELRSTGFGRTAADGPTLGSETCLTKEWGHTARIWGVHFLAPVAGQPKQLNLVSRGEDATCQLWTLEWDVMASDATRFRLRNVSTLHQHAGKHIWSLTILEGGTTSPVIYTGGADGAVRAFQLASPMDISLQSGYSTRVLMKAANSQVQTDAKLRGFAFVAPDCFITSSLAGALQLGWIDARSLDPNENKPHICWETLLEGDDHLRSMALMSTLPSRGLAVIGNGNGLIRLYNHRTRSLVDLAHETRPMGLFIFDQGADACGFLVTYPTFDLADLLIVKDITAAAPQVEQNKLVLPRTFQVSRVAAVCGGQYLMMGSKVGALAIYDVGVRGEVLHPLWCIRRVHGESAVTCILRIPVDEAEGPAAEYLLTCGRDANYCVHVLERTEEGSVRLRTVHRSSSSFSPNIEGAYFDASTNDLMLYGYRCNYFILWNESTQTELMSFDCGGAHRNWAFYPYADVFGGVGVYIWNQAASFHAIVTQSASHRPLRAGGHGREIKDMAIANAVDGTGGPLIATGAEDTTVRIFTPTIKASNDAPWGSFRCTRVLNKHRTGLQQVTWSRDGRFLFTSGGFEEFFVWRVSTIPVFGTAAVLEASSPKDDPKSDLRVTSFDVLEVEAPDDCFLLCLAYSNSTVKVFFYSSSATSQTFYLLGRGTYTTNCPTQARFLTLNSSTYLITCATDGQLAIWCLDSVLDGFESREDGSMAIKPTFSPETATAETISWQSHHTIHSSSIKSLEMMKIAENCAVFVGGGDDNALSISVLRMVHDGPSIRTISIPDAHASAITTIKTLRLQPAIQGQSSTEILLASSGNDHRIKIWSISVDAEKAEANDVEAVRIVQRLDRYSPVADISSMDILHRTDTDADMGLLMNVCL
ncbi:WD repeat protein [Rasamsonia emersonii CBS 393.64]|uniref:WD repeat protein n=1 Tax=Rasamsonia emersonii (strain ATCC 16479 / CBS 393.64 / IMI 116815) TaxID=1408163 RepID=A0A0F4YPY7_RASE3|nr:WD repeat protein [Rasamsonia emersonii CBS 393.64]KKA19683.1 WD repeat protein [Rasamsonia emersonii CBS 393.64]